ncbi:srv-25 [Pristionchus pacificus]|uniref:Srv-25 n=1 Tax=Pristionchus pacificus TaxID=54126 RepID=A0A2A6C3F9_PRIPA|nr:srv-25 [Pristionchus pacificus]|eukprot:PDM72638.1 srv-25 [Pristionchus pacificus]
MPRPELYFFLLPFTIISLLLYYRMLLAIFLRRHHSTYSTFFYRMTWSLAIYDISYVIVYFIMEIPQDWPNLYGFFYVTNGTIFPQFHYAHQWQCYLAQALLFSYHINIHTLQFYGVTLISISRMLLVCYPVAKLTKIVTVMSMRKILVFHGIPPLIYALYVLFFQEYRRYEYDVKAGTMTRIGDAWSIDFNSNVMIITSTAGALISALCYIRVFASLRNRPFRSWSREISVIITSFVLFISLCAMSVYFIINKYTLIAENWGVFYATRNLNYVPSFSIALINPWCLIITNPSIRRAVIGTHIRGLFTGVPVCSRFVDYSTTDEAPGPLTQPATRSTTVSTRNSANPT